MMTVRSAVSGQRSALGPANAVAVTPGAWNDRAPKARIAERLGSIESIVLRLMAGLEKQVRHGATLEQIEPVVTAWAGRLASFVYVDGLRASRRLVPTLTLRATHPGIIMELRPRIPRLLEDLKTTGITEIRFR